MDMTCTQTQKPAITLLFWRHSDISQRRKAACDTATLCCMFAFLLDPGELSGDKTAKLESIPSPQRHQIGCKIARETAPNVLV